MAELNPIFLSSGSIRQMTSSLNTVVDYIHFPVSQSGSSAIFTTNLPDPYLFASLSANITSPDNLTNTSLYQYNIPNRLEKYFYASNAIVGVSTTNATIGVRIGLLRSQLANTAFNIKSPITLTSFTFACVTTLSNTTYALPGGHADINTIYPTHVKGLTSNILTSFTSSNISNTYVLQSEGGATVVSASAGSIFYNQFAGYLSLSLEKDTSFGTGTGFNDIVNSIYQQSDGKILVGGSFTNYNSSTQNRLIRLNSDGTIDTSLNIGTGFGNNVNSVYQQSDGKILVGGQFNTYSGSTQNRLVRLNSNGTRDTSFNVGTGFDNDVRSISEQLDGKILVGGSFTIYSGSTQNRLVRLNSDGTIDTSFDTGTGFNNTVSSVYLQSDGKILAGGEFTTYSGSSPSPIRFIRLNSDGTRDTSFNVGTGFNGSVQTIYQQSDGKVLVGGNFSTYRANTFIRIVRVNTDGDIDISFTPGDGFSGQVQEVIQQPDGKILVGGGFSTYSGSAQLNITRLNSNGNRDTSFNTGTGLDNNVNSVYLQSDGKVLAGGGFTSYNDTLNNRIIRLLPTPVTYTPKSPLYFNSGSLNTVSGSDTITQSFLPSTSSLWLSQSLATTVVNTSNTVYATVFTLTGLTTGQRYLANLYMIGSSAISTVGFRMRVVTGSQYMGTLWTPISTTAPAIQNSANGDNITSIIATSWPTSGGKYLVHGEYTFVKGATDPQVQILTEGNGTAVRAFSGSVIFYRPIS
jgi:uncharacterized delta-60 repeat protein